jgi:hypothetical protein
MPKEDAQCHGTVALAGGSTDRDRQAVTTASESRPMDTSRMETAAIVDCPWCGGDAEIRDAASTVTCDACRVEVALAPDSAPARRFATA